MWKILGIEPTTDVKTIRKAYSKRLHEINPTEQPQEFQQLKIAFDRATDWAKWTKKVAINEDKTQENPETIEKPQQNLSEPLKAESNWNLEATKTETAVKTDATDENQWKLDAQEQTIEPIKSDENQWKLNLPDEVIKPVKSDDRQEEWTIESSEEEADLTDSSDNDWELPEADKMTFDDQSQFIKIQKPLRKKRIKASSWLVLLLIIVGVRIFSGTGSLKNSSQQSPIESQIVHSAPSLPPVKPIHIEISENIMLNYINQDIPLSIEKKLTNPDASGNTLFGFWQIYFQTNSFNPLHLTDKTPISLTTFAMSSAPSGSSQFVDTENGKLTRLVVKNQVIAYVLFQSENQEVYNGQLFGKAWGTPIADLDHYKKLYENGQK